jgi:hypothetical protein
MANIPVYNSLEEKRKFFKNDDFFIIDKKVDLDRWFDFYSSSSKEEQPTDFIFRGMSDAKYKLFTSAQRFWIIDNMEQWRPHYSYQDFIQDLVNKAKQNPLLKRVFELYGYRIGEEDFPILSLLQHYGAPSPVLDWTYNKYCAVFFAIDGVQRKFNAGNLIDNYISIYSIHKKRLSERRELLSLYDIVGEKYPPIAAFRHFAEEQNPHANALFIISDFEDTTQKPYRGKLKVRNRRPLTSLFNQNIIPQEGLLMYNPFKDRPIEKLFKVDLNVDGQNLHLEPFNCFNIHKDLSEYLRRLIANRHKITKIFIYPYLYDDAKEIKEAVLNGLAV